MRELTIDVHDDTVSTVKSHNYESRYKDRSRYNNMLCEDAVMEASMEKSHYYDGFSADWALL